MPRHPQQIWWGARTTLDSRPLLLESPLLLTLPSCRSERSAVLKVIGLMLQDWADPRLLPASLPSPLYPPHNPITYTHSRRQEGEGVGWQCWADLWLEASTGIARPSDSQDPQEAPKCLEEVSSAPDPLRRMLLMLLRACSRSSGMALKSLQERLLKLKFDSTRQLGRDAEWSRDRNRSNEKSWATVVCERGMMRSGALKLVPQDGAGWRAGARYPEGPECQECRLRTGCCFAGWGTPPWTSSSSLRLFSSLLSSESLSQPSLRQNTLRPAPCFCFQMATCSRTGRWANAHR